MAVKTRSRATERDTSSTAEDDLTMHTAIEHLGTDDDEDDDDRASTSSSSTVRALLAKARAKYDDQETEGQEEELETIQLADDSDDEAVLAHQPSTKAQSKKARLPIVPSTTGAREAASSKNRPRDRFGLPPPRPPLPPSQLRLLRSLPAHRLPASILSHPRSASHLRKPLPFHELPLSDARDPSVKREIQALRLHNSLDPKRFYRGGGGGKDRDKVPERMAFGHVVDSGMGARVGEKGPQQRAVRKRSFLEALVADETAKAYAKKKYVGEVQKRAGSGGKLFYRRLQQKRQGRR